MLFGLPFRIAFDLLASSPGAAEAFFLHVDPYWSGERQDGEERERI